MLPCPIRAIRSRVLAPAAAASMFPVWRRSWKCRPGVPSLATQLVESTSGLKFPCRIGAPFGPVNTNAFRLRPTYSVRCARSSVTTLGGSVTTRRPGYRTNGTDELCPHGVLAYAATLDPAAAHLVEAELAAAELGAIQWLPLTSGPSVFSAQRVTGQPTLMGRVDQLVVELQALARRAGMSDEDLSAARMTGPPPSDAYIQAAGRFGLAIFLNLAQTAQRERQPLLLDY